MHMWGRGRPGKKTPHVSTTVVEITIVVGASLQPSLVCRKCQTRATSQCSAMCFFGADACVRGHCLGSLRLTRTRLTDTHTINSAVMWLRVVVSAQQHGTWQAHTVPVTDSRTTKMTQPMGSSVHAVIVPLLACEICNICKSRLLKG